MKVQNGYSARQIRVNSVLKGLFGTTSMEAILDTGASAHVLNTMKYMTNATADNSFSLVGVNGVDSQMTFSYAGYLNVYLSAKTFDGRPIVVNISGEQNDGSRRNAHLASSSPVTLVSWDQLLERGWRMAEDSSYIFHRSIEAKVYLTRRNGLFYLPICAEQRTQAPLVTAGAVRAVSGSEDTHARYPALTSDESNVGFREILWDSAASPPKRNFLFQLFWIFFCCFLIEHGERSRLAVSACACVRAFAQSRTSKFRFRRFLGFLKSLRPSL